MEFLANLVYVPDVRSPEEKSTRVRDPVEFDSKSPELTDPRSVEELDPASGVASVSPLMSLRTKRLAIAPWDAGIRYLRMQESMHQIKT